jgi:cytochrome oxidase Cu insertion factor (SCO1/SenC/PrrC family)
MRPAFFFLTLFLTGCGATLGTRSHPEPGQTDVDYPVGAFSLTERSGRTVTDQDLRGHVWVASFIFTRCNGPCPQVTSTVARLQSELKDLPDVRFVTFTVDPKRDDLSALRAYADNRKADPTRWLFLTGDEETIHKLMKEQFKQAIERKSGPDVKPGDEFGHSTRLILIDRKNVIRTLCEGLPDEHFPDQFESNVARFEARIRELEKE